MVTVAVAVGAGVSVAVVDGVTTGVLVADGTRLRVGVAAGRTVKVAVTSGTSVGERKAVGVRVSVGDGTGVGELACRRQTRLAKPRQYIHDVVRMTSASSHTHSIRRPFSSSYRSRSLLNRTAPAQCLPRMEQPSQRFAT